MNCVFSCAYLSLSLSWRWLPCGPDIDLASCRGTLMRMLVIILLGAQCGDATCLSPSTRFASLIPFSSHTRTSYNSTPQYLTFELLPDLFVASLSRSSKFAASRGRSAENGLFIHWIATRMVVLFIHTISSQYQIYKLSNRHPILPVFFRIIFCKQH